MFYRMAMSRVLTCFMRQRHLFSYTMPMISSKAIVCFPFSTSQSIYLGKYSVAKSNKSESNNKVQVDYVEVGKFIILFGFFLTYSTTVITCM
jgi:hypothetical protein